MLRRLNICVGMILISLASYGSTENSSVVLQDFDYFFEQLEAIHPDPYTAFGGKDAFSRAVKSLRNDLQQRDSLTISDAQFEVRKLISVLHDGHTYMGFADVPKVYEHRWLPFNFRILPDGNLIVNGVAKNYEYLRGARLLEIDDVPVDTLLERLGHVEMVENRYGLLCKARDYFRNNNCLRLLLNGQRSTVNGQQQKCRFILSDGNEIEKTFPMFPDKDPIWKEEWSGSPGDSRFPTENMTYKKVSDGAMVFRMTSVMSRDCVPDSLNWPILADVFGKMLVEMRDANADTLIIDLRNNGGGYTPILFPTLYQLFGDDFLKKDFKMGFKTKISEMWLKKRGLTIEKLNGKDKNYKLGDYIDDTSCDGYKGILNDSIRESISHSWMMADPSVAQSLHGKPVYTPKHIFVVTNAFTFSSAFHYTYLLWKMGATIVGVPSSQATNTFMECTYFTLPKSGIQCSVSNSIQHFVPDDNPCANILWPQIMPTYDDYKSFNFDSNSELLYILKK